jgi:16S rRNA (cytidine1402-2'-O)-methyltransferase
MNSSTDTVLYESPYRILKLIKEITALDENREIFCAKELSKKFQNYYRGKSKEILEKFETINSKGEWVVVVEAKPNKRKRLYLEEILTLDIPPKIKAKLLAKITDKTTKDWYKELIS